MAKKKNCLELTFWNLIEKQLGDDLREQWKHNIAYYLTFKS